ncbi:MAG: cupredoxin domain-containing protein [Sphingobacteriia bacterium]|nr:cupredoxin domain-containing protein [Sphingobacteriia bacterium]
MVKNFFVISLILLIDVIACNAKTPIEAEIRIKEHKFVPEILELPAGERIKLKVINEDDTAEEFESHDLKREKIVSANSSTIVAFGPLEPGEYKFFGEFHEETAQGIIKIK